VEERTHEEQLSDELLAEVEAESDLLDADVEEPEPPIRTAERERISPDLDPQDVVEAEAEADLVDADLEDV